MVLHSDLSIDFPNHAILVQQESGSFDAHEGFTEHALLLPYAVEAQDFSFGVTE